VNRPLFSVKRAAKRLRTADSRGFAWGFASQGASSVTNLGLSVLAGRILGPSGLGSIFVGFSFYLLATGFLRSLITDPLLAATASLDDDARRGATRSALTTTLLLAAVATTLLIVAAITVPSKVGHGLILFVPWLVPALVQDFWRSVLFRDRRGAAGTLNDTLWFAGMAVTLPLVLLVRTDWIVVANWGFGALVAAAAGLVQTRVTPAGARTSVRWWWMRAWKLGRWLAAETIIYTVASQVLVFIMAGILGTRPLGGLRAVGTLFGPLTLLAPAIALPGLPAISRVSAESAERAVRLAISIGVLGVLLTGCYLAVAAALSDQLLEEVFGPSFTQFGALILPIGVGQILIAGTMGFALLLKAQARGKALLAARVVGSVSSLVFVLSLAATNGVTGAAWGMALAGGVSSLALVACGLSGWFPPLPPLPVRTPRQVPGLGSTHVIEQAEETARESPPN
jgi:O-antigen/teichoic acid export membrane protein